MAFETMTEIMWKTYPLSTSPQWKPGNFFALALCKEIGNKLLRAGVQMPLCFLTLMYTETNKPKNTEI